MMLLAGLWGVGYEQANLKDIGPGVVVGKTRPAFQKVHAVVDTETGARYLISCVRRLPEIGQRVHVLANWRRTYFTALECADENRFGILALAFWATFSVFVAVLSFRYFTK
jgi:hypothetical protein